MFGDVTVLRELLEPVIEAIGYELVMVELTGAGSKTLRVYIDSPGGIVLDDCETLAGKLALCWMWMIRLRVNMHWRFHRRALTGP